MAQALNSFFPSDSRDCQPTHSHSSASKLPKQFIFKREMFVKRRICFRRNSKRRCVIAEHQPSCRDLLGMSGRQHKQNNIRSRRLVVAWTCHAPQIRPPTTAHIALKHAVAKFSDKNNFFLAKDSNLLGNYHVSTFLDATCVSAHWCHAWSMTLLVLLGRAAIDHFGGNSRENHGRNLSNCAANKSFIALATNARTVERVKWFFF